MKRAAFVVTKSEHLRERAIQMGISPSKVRTIRNGCNPTVFHLGDRSAARAQLVIDDKTELVLFVGRLDTAKGIEELLRSLCVACESPSKPPAGICRRWTGWRAFAQQIQTSCAGKSNHSEWCVLFAEGGPVARSCQCARPA